MERTNRTTALNQLNQWIHLTKVRSRNENFVREEGCPHELSCGYSRTCAIFFAPRPRAFTKIAIFVLQNVPIDRTEPKKKIRFAKQKIRFDFFGSTPTRPGRNLTRTFPKTEPKFGLQNLPNEYGGLIRLTSLLKAKNVPRSARKWCHYQQTFTLDCNRDGFAPSVRVYIRVVSKCRPPLMKTRTEGAETISAAREPASESSRRLPQPVFFKNWYIYQQSWFQWWCALHCQVLPQHALLTCLPIPLVVLHGCGRWTKLDETEKLRTKCSSAHLHRFILLHPRRG